MAAGSLTALVEKLERQRYRFGAGEAARTVRLLRELGRRRFTDAALLIRFHEALLFVRAFAHSAAVAQTSERLLRGFARRVEELRKAGANMETFDPLEVSGIAGTEMADTLSFDVARWLVRRAPRQVEVDWKEYTEERAMAATWPRWMPLLEDDAYVEANIPWRRWLETAQGSRSASPAWLIERAEKLAVGARERAEIYDSMRVPLRWKVGESEWSRTRNRVRNGAMVYQTTALTARSEVSLERELGRRRPELKRFSRKQGEAVMDRIREIMLVRYRELYGTTLGDAASVRRADVGRGVSMYWWNLPAERRLPLRAYVAGFTVKNGVPINYVEAIGLCEWMEVGFNTFYTFRGGEAGWIYAQALRCLRALMGTSVISVYPYQLGQQNDEALDSGAFWFYRKLGFRPGGSDELRLAEREDRRIAADGKYRTSRGTLRRLAESHVFYEMPGSETGAWDRFSTRKLGLRVNRRMASGFGGDSVRMRKELTETAVGRLRLQIRGWSELERRALGDFALVLGEIEDLERWTTEEKRELAAVIRSKAAADEMGFMRRTQRHERLRRELLRLGSR